ncbi:MAG: hypothetical protein ACPG4T_21040, partial [Nannocystaceae bacterium]
GNHDLVRPDRICPETIVLERWEDYPEVQEDFWGAASSRYRVFVEEMFANYTQWLDNTPFEKPASFTPGILPGDFSATIECDGFELGVIGLNSAFLQLGNGDYEGRLAVDVRQFHGPCVGDGPAWLRRHDCALLLTHHPPQWLSPRARKHLYAEIHPPGKFAGHLYGHMHEHALTSTSVGATAPRRELQGSSLFGLDHWGEVDKQTRHHGYSAGAITLCEDGQASMRIWPRVGRRHAAGHWHIRQDLDAYALEDDDGTKPVVVELLRTPQQPRVDRGDEQQSSSGGQWAELNQHLKYLIEETSCLDIGRVSAQGWMAQERRLEEFYTPLYTNYRRGRNGKQLCGQWAAREMSSFRGVHSKKSRAREMWSV